MGHTHTGNSSKKGGCYTKETTGSPKRCTGSGVCNEEDWGGYDEVTGERHHFWVGSCNVCHGRLDGERGEVVQCTNIIYDKVYVVNCGLAENTPVRKTKDLSTMTSSEKIISAVITY